MEVVADGGPPPPTTTASGPPPPSSSSKSNIASTLLHAIVGTDNDSGHVAASTRAKPQVAQKPRGCFIGLIECSPFPPDDDGVPPPCRITKFCFLNHGFFVNNLSIAKSFGKCGLAYMDNHRRFLFGVASWTTLCAFFLGIWGCLALTTGASVVQRAYWLGARVTDNSNNQQYSMYIGLRSFVYVNCGFVPGWDSYPSGCTRSTILFTDAACSSGPFAAACQACDANAKSMWTTAFFGCAGLVLAWLGQQTRMRRCADTPVQKLLGVFTEVSGVASTAVAMFQFNSECKLKLSTAVTNSNFTGNYSLGPGYICFILVTCSGVVRFVVNALVPLPPPDPIEPADKLDVEMAPKTVIAP